MQGQRSSTWLGLGFVLTCAVGVLGCPPPPPHRQLDMVPIGVWQPPDGPAPSGSSDADGTPAPTDSGPAAPAEKSADCAGTRFENLYLALTNPACQVDTGGDKPSDVKADLDVSVSTKTNEIVPGGRVDLVVTYRNKGQKPLPLNFVLDPSPRFDVDAYDTKGRPAGVPKGRQPRPNKQVKKTTARITLQPGGVAKAKLGWTASNMRWATEQVKGEVPDGGYPKTATTPLQTGTYTLRLVTPLILVQESADRELSAPKVAIDVKD